MLVSNSHYIMILEQEYFILFQQSFIVILEDFYNHFISKQF